jgi:hypothetical protein
MGISFQAEPEEPLSQILLHLRLRDPDAAQQQEALGIVGVNLVYGAAFLHEDPETLLRSLLDELSTERIEIDLIEFSGHRFRAADNRVMSLRLVQLGLSGVAAFGPDGSVLQPSELLHNAPVLVERGRFRPVTRVHLDMIRCASDRFRADLGGAEPVVLAEITMRNLLSEGDVDLRDFLDRADALAAMGYRVLISDYFEYWRLAAYLARHTNGRIGLVMGANLLQPSVVSSATTCASTSIPISTPFASSASTPIRSRFPLRSASSTTSCASAEPWWRSRATTSACCRSTRMKCSTRSASETELGRTPSPSRWRA